MIEPKSTAEAHGRTWSPLEDSSTCERTKPKFVREKLIKNRLAAKFKRDSKVIKDKR